MGSMVRVAGFLVATVVSGVVLLGIASFAVADGKAKGDTAHKHFKGEVIGKDVPDESKERHTEIAVDVGRKVGDHHDKH